MRYLKYSAPVNTFRKSCRKTTNPIVLLSLHVLSFPFNSCIIAGWVWPLFFYYNLIGPIVGKFRISPESSCFDALSTFIYQIRCLNSIKSCDRQRARRISSRVWLWKPFLMEAFTHFAMFFNPKFVIILIRADMRHFNMRIISHSRMCIW